MEQLANSTVVGRLFINISLRLVDMHQIMYEEHMELPALRDAIRRIMQDAEYTPSEESCTLTHVLVADLHRISERRLRALHLQEIPTSHVFLYARGFNRFLQDEDMLLPNVREEMVISAILGAARVATLTF